MHEYTHLALPAQTAGLPQPAAGREALPTTATEAGYQRPPAGPVLKDRTMHDQPTTAADWLFAAAYGLAIGCMLAAFI